jgi:SAM-dependent methyltransferase
MTTRTRLPPASPASPTNHDAAHDLAYSVRRGFVDEFFTRHASALPPRSRVLDLGGMKGKSRGTFSLSRYPLEVTVANVSPNANPDVLCDAAHVPLESASFDAVILSEVLEHLLDPEATLHECARLLRPGGALLATAPFLFRVHPDPIDVARYTATWWEDRLTRAGFASLEIERQGMFFSVMAEFLRGWVLHLETTGAFWPGMRGAAIDLVRWAREQAVRRERDVPHDDAYLRSYTTGFGVRGVRRERER